MVSVPETVLMAAVDPDGTRSFNIFRENIENIRQLHWVIINRVLFLFHGM
jgi:hypothetical protein